MALGVDERGVYITAIAAIASHGGAVEKDELRRLCPCDLRVYRRCLETLLKLRKLVEKEGYLTNKRVVSELKNGRKRIVNAVKNGRKGGQQSAKNRALEKQSVRLPSPTPTPASTPKGSEAPLSGSEPIRNNESDPARAVGLKGRRNPVERRCASPAAAPKQTEVRQKIKQQLGQKLIRYCNARLSGPERTAAVMGLMGEDPEHDGQWWFDEIDRRRKRDGWDDTREWKRTSGLRALG